MVLTATMSSTLVQFDHLSLGFVTYSGINHLRVSLREAEIQVKELYTSG